MSQKLFYSVAEAAEMLGVSRGLVYSSVKKGEIPFRTIGARVLIPSLWVEAQSAVTDPDPGTPDPTPSSEAS